jgi:hypothetical protein
VNGYLGITNSLGNTRRGSGCRARPTRHPPDRLKFDYEANAIKLYVDPLPPSVSRRLRPRWDRRELEHRPEQRDLE